MAARSRASRKVVADDAFAGAGGGVWIDKNVVAAVLAALGLEDHLQPIAAAPRRKRQIGRTGRARDPEQRGARRPPFRPVLLFGDLLAGQHQLGAAGKAGVEAVDIRLRALVRLGLVVAHLAVGAVIRHQTGLRPQSELLPFTWKFLVG